MICGVRFLRTLRLASWQVGKLDLNCNKIEGGGGDAVRWGEDFGFRRPWSISSYIDVASWDVAGLFGYRSAGVRASEYDLQPSEHEQTRVNTRALNLENRVADEGW